MAKKINEAQVKIDIAGLESSDFETLSRMLALAGQAEQPAMGGSMVPPMAPLDFDSIGASPEAEVGAPGETQPIMNPDDAMSADEMGAEVDPLANAVGELTGGATDFGADDAGMDMPGDEMGMSMDDEMGAPEETGDLSLDLSGQPQLESTEQDEDDEIIEEEFDFHRMFSLAGLVSEDIDMDEDSGEEDIGHEDGDVSSDADEITETQILPDLSLEEDTPVPDTTDYGPFCTERDAVMDGQKQTNGVEGDNFNVITKGNQFYWRRTMQEEVDNEPQPEYYDNEGNTNRVHEFKPKFPGTALGDNPLNVKEAEEEDDEESVEDIFESLQSKYNKFLGGK